jgi:hypothetical protein
VFSSSLIYGAAKMALSASEDGTVDMLQLAQDLNSNADRVELCTESLVISFNRKENETVLKTPPQAARTIFAYKNLFSGKPRAIEPSLAIKYQRRMLGVVVFDNRQILARSVLTIISDGA